MRAIMAGGLGRAELQFATSIAAPARAAAVAEDGSCEELDSATLDARRHTVAIEFDLVDPIGAAGRFLHQF
jgi:hypothetical protein